MQSSNIVPLWNSLQPSLILLHEHGSQTRNATGIPINISAAWKTAASSYETTTIVKSIRDRGYYSFTRVP